MPTPAFTITGTIQDLSGTADVGYARIKLANYHPYIPLVSGTSLVAAPEYIATCNGSGVFSVTLWGNDQLSPTNTYYTVQLVSASGQQSLPLPYSFTGSGTQDLSQLAPLTAAPSGAVTLIPATVPYPPIAGFTIGGVAVGPDTGRYGTNAVRFSPITTNTNGAITVMPSGTSTESSIRLYNTSDAANVGAVEIDLVGTTLTFDCENYGTGTKPTALDLSQFATVRTPNLGVGITPTFVFQVQGSAAGSAIAKIKNTSATGFGVKFVPGVDTNYGIAVSNAAETLTNFTVDGSGNVTASGFVDAIQANIVNGDSGHVPSGTKVIVGNTAVAMGSGTGKAYGVIGAARGSADVAGDRAYGGWFYGNAQNQASTEVGIHAEVTDAGGTPAEFYANGAQVMKIGGTGAVIGVVGSSVFRDAMQLLADSPRLYFGAGSSFHNFKVANQDSTGNSLEISIGAGSQSDPTADTYTPVALFASGTTTLKGVLAMSGSTSGTTTVKAAATASGALTLPAATDTLVGQNTTDTLANKTISTSNNTLTGVLVESNFNTGIGSSFGTPISVPANTTTLLGADGVAMPSKGGPFRVMISYGVCFAMSTTAGTVDCWITDGTNTMALSQMAYAASTTGGQNGFAVSAVTYGNSAAPTFSLECRSTQAGAANNAANNTGAPNSFMTISVISAV